MHFARACGFGVYKSDTIAEMRRAQRLVAARLETEFWQMALAASG
jgi:thiaminase